MLVTALPKLHATSPDPLRFAPDVYVRAFVLERDAGDLLVYAAPSSKGLGEVAAQYLNHWHDAARSPTRPTPARAWTRSSIASAAARTTDVTCRRAC